MDGFEAVQIAFETTQEFSVVTGLIDSYLAAMASTAAEGEPKREIDRSAVRLPSSLWDAERVLIGLAAYFGRLDVLQALESTRFLDACDVTGLPCLTCLLGREYFKRPVTSGKCWTGGSHGSKQTIIMYAVAGGHVPTTAYLAEKFARSGFSSLDDALVTRFGQVGACLVQDTCCHIVYIGNRRYMTRVVWRSRRSLDVKR
jgi:hypothetical protein